MHREAQKRIREWWLGRLLGQKTSTHPIFGDDIRVDVDGDAVTLSGTVRSAEDADELEREAASIDTVKTVINRLRVVESGDRYHLQTVIGIYGDADAAKLACQAVENWTMHTDQGAALLSDPDTARRQLQTRAQAAHVPEDAISGLVDAVQAGKALLVTRVSEDDALRVLSELEGSRAEKVVTLPPEPGAVTTS